MKIKISFDKIEAFVFDFDGVLTNNLVYLDQNGKESVCCSRSDGLAFDVMRKLKKPSFILSTEVNPVITARANKIKIPVFQGCTDKMNALKDIADKKGLNLQNTLYVGNDLNDYKVMQLCGYSACPIDSHAKIKEIATIVLNTSGGEGVVRELLEDVFKINFIRTLYD